MDDLQSSGQRVLLVEDEIRLGESIQRGIARHGHEVDLRSRLRIAIAAGLLGDYDVLVLDINLPDAVGWDALTALDAARQAPAHDRPLRRTPQRRPGTRVRPGLRSGKAVSDRCAPPLDRASGGSETIGSARYRREQHPMIDIFMLLLIVGAFALMIGYVAGCDRL